MPRLAPVSRSARRGWFECGVTIRSNPTPSALGSLWIDPRLASPRAMPIAPELDAVVQPERAILPELHDNRIEAVAGPIGRARHRPDGEFRGRQRDRLLERQAALERCRLLARPGAD